MDMPNVDLYQLLNPPAIVEHYKPTNSLENLLIAKDHARKKHSTAIKKKEILSAIGRPLILMESIDEKISDRILYEFRVNLLDGSLVAGFVYNLDENKQPKLNKIIYLREGMSALVIVYKRELRGRFDWENPKNVIDIFEDKNDLFEPGLKERYENYKKLEEIKQRRREDEGVIMYAKAK